MATMEMTDEEYSRVRRALSGVESEINVVLANNPSLSDITKEELREIGRKVSEADRTIARSIKR